MPFNLICGFQDVFMVDFYEPLGLGKDFYRGIAAPAEPDILLKRLLVIEEACGFKVGNDSLPAFGNAHAFILACSFCHLALLVDGFYER